MLADISAGLSIFIAIVSAIVALFFTIIAAAYLAADAAVAVRNRRRLPS